jgi:hypothetical protein
MDHLQQSDAALDRFPERPAPGDRTDAAGTFDDHRGARRLRQVVVSGCAAEIDHS